MDVQLKNHHNHGVDIPDALRHRDVAPEVNRQIRTYLASHHTPAQAQERIKQQLQSECCSVQQYGVLSADRSMVPDYQYICRLSSINVHIYSTILCRGAYFQLKLTSFYLCFTVLCLYTMPVPCQLSMDCTTNYN